MNNFCDCRETNVSIKPFDSISVSWRSRGDHTGLSPLNPALGKTPGHKLWVVIMYVNCY
jgi:hypothetical protein